MAKISTLPGSAHGEQPWSTALVHTFNEFRKISQNFTFNHGLVFILIAQKPDITQIELVEATGLNDGTISRICKVLSDAGLPPNPGLGLIDAVALPRDNRTRGQRPSAKGARVLSTIKFIMETAKA